MSKLQDSNNYKTFKTMAVFPVVSSIDTLAWEFGGAGKAVANKAFPICQDDIQDLRSGKYGPKYTIGDYPIETVLVKHPFRPYELIPSDTSENQIITDHLTDLATIFTALGANECEEIAKITKRETVKIDAKGKMKIKNVKINVDDKHTKDNSLDSEYKLVIKHEPDDNNGFNNAYRMAEKYGLLEVKNIKNIFEIFDPEKGGQTKSYQLSEVLTEEYHKTINAVISVNASGTFSFKGSLNVDHECRRTIRIDKTITFP